MERNCKYCNKTFDILPYEYHIIEEENVDFKLKKNIKTKKLISLYSCPYCQKKYKKSKNMNNN